MHSPSASGLDGIVVAQTALSEVDGERGRLVIRGYTVEDLVERATFEDVCGLMWNAAWPSPNERAALRAALSEARQQAFTLVSTLGEALKSTDGMEALRAAVGHLRAVEQHADRLRLTGAIPVFAAAWARENSGQPFVPPQPGLSQGGALLVLDEVQKVPHSLAGRFEIVHLPHWTWAEMQEAFDWKVEQYLFYGGLPRSRAAHRRLRSMGTYIRDSLIETTIARDVLLLSRVDSPPS